MHKYSCVYERNALLPIKFQKTPKAFVDYCHTFGGYVARLGTWFQDYAKTCIQVNINCRCRKVKNRRSQAPAPIPARSRRGSPPCPTGTGERNDLEGRPDWKKTVATPRNGKIILEIRIDICYTDFVPSSVGTDETLPAPRGSVSADKFVRKVSNWKTIPSIS